MKWSKAVVRQLGTGNAKRLLFSISRREVPVSDQRPFD
jgi:hypothetical protein